MILKNLFVLLIILIGVVVAESTTQIFECSFDDTVDSRCGAQISVKGQALYQITDNIKIDGYRITDLTSTSIENNWESIIYLMYLNCYATKFK